MKSEWSGRWKGRTVVCIASGPSLTEQDCEAVRLAGHPALVTNTTYQRCLWADVLVGHDGRWWNKYGALVDATFAGARVTSSSAGRLPGSPKTLSSVPGFMSFHNSGANAISLAITGGAQRVLMLGFDCRKAPNGVSHWHGDHPRELSNARSIAAWPKHFAAVARLAADRHVAVVNCSRSTVLTCFPRAALEASL